MNDERLSLREEHEELYGILLLANQKIKDVGTTLIWVLGVGVLAFCVAIHLRWFDTVLGISVEEVRSVWVYVLLAVCAFVLFFVYTQAREKVLYRSFKPAILSYLRDKDISIYSMVARIEGDSSLSDIAEKLMEDPQIPLPGDPRHP
jgi:hypothetical protein